MRGFIIPHSHWDREWYLTFQQFRFKLVKLVDSVLDILENDPRFKHFTLDGQTVILEDYLEINPGERERIERLIRDGRLLIGPWYVLPDEFLVSGESIIRNLQKGLNICSSFGQGMFVGYVPDQFGHIAQLPQIFQAAGIDTAVLWRGVGSECRDTQFVWEAPDGSSVDTFYLMDTYGNAAGLPEEAEELARSVNALVESQRPFLSTQAILLMNGSDHAMPQPRLPAALAEAGLLSGTKLEISTLPLYIDHMRKSDTRFSHICGELRSGERAPLLVSCASSRMYQKQRNHELEILLEKYAEPFACWSWLQKDPYPANFLQEAWHQLLLNQPHDSICGCCNDQVHREIEIRFDRGEQIATLVNEESMNRLVGHVDTRNFEGKWGLLVFNPHPVPVNYPVEAELPDTGGNSFSALTDDDGNAMPWQPLSGGRGEYFSVTGTPLQARMALGMIHGREVQGLYLNDFRIGEPDRDGLLRVDLIMGNDPIGEMDVDALKKMALEILADKRIKRIRAVARQSGERGLFLAKNLPPCGWRSYSPASGAREDRQQGDLQVGRRSLENSFYRIKFNADGTFDLLDRKSGIKIPRLHRLVDGGDRGDLYTFTAPEEDRLVKSPSLLTGGVKFEVTEIGPVRATIRMTRNYRLPTSLQPDRRKRSRRKVNCRITTSVSLYSGTPGIYFETIIDNRARDHRLRVHFTAPFPAQKCWADGHFAVIHRSAQPPAGDYSAWAEKPDGLAPQKQFVAIDDGNFGIAVINRGLPEYEVLPGTETGGGEIALTLLRSVGWLSRGDLANRPEHAGPAVETPEGQCPGEQAARYALLPYQGTWQEGRVKLLANLFNAPPCSLAAGRKSGSLPASHSMFGVEPGDIQLSCMKKADDGDAVIVRLFNCSDREQEAEIRPGFHFREVFRANLLEEPSGEPLQASPGAIKLNLKPWQIATLRFEI